MITSARLLACLAAAAGLAAFAPAPATAQDFVVTASTAASVGPGRMLAGDAALSLAAGEAVTLLGPTGPVEVTGPFEGVARDAAGVAASSGPSALTALVSRRERMTKLGAFRGDAEGDAPTPAAFDLFADEAWCVDGGGAPTLFVAPRGADRVIVLTEAGGAAAEMLWPAGAATQPWPAEAPFRAGLSYAAAVGGVDIGAFRLSPAPGGATPTAKIEGLVEAGCFSQAEAELARLEAGG